jgi:hypothetical protein
MVQHPLRIAKRPLNAGQCREHNGVVATQQHEDSQQCSPARQVLAQQSLGTCALTLTSCATVLKLLFSCSKARVREVFSALRDRFQDQLRGWSREAHSSGLVHNNATGGPPKGSGHMAHYIAISVLRQKQELRCWWAEQVQHHSGCSVLDIAVPGTALGGPGLPESCIVNKPCT